MGVRELRRSILLSFLIHCFLASLCIFLTWKQASEKPAPKLTYIELETPSSQTPKEKKDPDDFTKKIVQTEKGKIVERALPKAFLGERNQEVDRQTVNQGQLTEMAKSAKAKAPPKPDKKENAGKDHPKNNEMANQSIDPLSQFGLKILPESKSDVGPKESDRAWADDTDLTASQAKDYVKGLNTGDRTALNTREFVFYGYFQRIRSQLDRAWYPILRKKLDRFYANGRKLASDMDHTTRLVVVLNKSGEIIKVKVVQESGTADLDEAAVRAFNEAGPFPNPPQGIIDASGEIRIPWEFIIKT